MTPTEIPSPTSTSDSNPITLNVFLCARNNAKTLHKTFECLENMENKFLNHTIKYHIFENDSNDNTLELLNSFMNNRKGNLKSVKLRKPQWEHIKSKQRISDMALYRNLNKSQCNDLDSSEFSIILDTDIYFSPDIIHDFLNILNNSDDLAMVCPFGYMKDARKVYYDTYALRTMRDRQIFPLCIGTNIVEVQSAFGGIVMIRSEILKKCTWGIPTDDRFNEHVYFCEQVRKYGKICIAKNITCEWTK